MKVKDTLPWLIFLAAILGTLTGCTTPSDESPTFKARGVYTTVALEDKELDMPASGYTSNRSFGLHQLPAAVVVGYGYSSRGIYYAQPFDLDVIEVSTGAVILRRHGNSLPGKASVLELPITRSGQYQVRVFIKEKLYDTWDFAVTRKS